MKSQFRKAILAIALIGAGSINTPAQAISSKRILAGLGTVFFVSNGIDCFAAEAV